MTRIAYGLSCFLLLVGGCSPEQSLSRQARWTGSGCDTSRDPAASNAYKSTCVYNQDHSGDAEQMRAEAVRNGVKALKSDGYDLVSVSGPFDASLNIATKFNSAPNVAIGRSYRGFSFVLRGYKAATPGAPADARPLVDVLADANAGRIVPSTDATPAAVMSARFVRPVPGGVLKRFGEDGLAAVGERDNGQPLTEKAINTVDFEAAPGTNVVAIDGGVVNMVGRNFVVVTHTDNYFTVYLCLQSVSVRVGDAVGKSNAIGRSGTCSGQAVPAVRLSVRHGRQLVDPLSLMAGI